jgi:hypothetical protein
MAEEQQTALFEQAFDAAHPRKVTSEQELRLVRLLQSDARVRCHHFSYIDPNSETGFTNSEMTFVEAPVPEGWRELFDRYVDTAKKVLKLKRAAKFPEDVPDYVLLNEQRQPVGIGNFERGDKPEDIARLACWFRTTALRLLMILPAGVEAV